MSSTYTYPGVYIQELPSAVHTITGVATSIAAFVGYTHPWKTSAFNTAASSPVWFSKIFAFAAP